MSVRGLVVSPTKTHIVHISKGFDFLSRFYCKIDGHIHCIPSDKAVKNLEEDLENIILNTEEKWSQKKIIQTINAKLHGWASYHRAEESMEVFKHIDVIVSLLLLKLMVRMYPNKSKEALIAKYWQTDSLGRKSFTLTTNKNIKIMNLADVVLVEHKKINVKDKLFCLNLVI